MDASKRIEDMIVAPLEGMGYEVVRVQISGSQQKTLQIMVERLDGKTVVVEDCATARIELRRLIDGRRRIRGKLAGLVEDMVRIDVDGTVIELPFAEIDRAKLILTDELLALAGAGDVEH